ncbi:putative C-type lectin 3 protein [Naja naja]|nr:putative C-type lectin 3 protein [Naja naja]
MLLITCFIFGLLGSLTWAECQEKWRGHLASFKSDKESELIGAYVTRKNIENHFVWIGLQRVSGSNLGT